jgi:hypothetical protein
MIEVRQLRPVHPFPARMAASIPLEKLTAAKGRLTVVDPMSGSGTTIYLARALGHRAIGFDSDPLACVVSRVWCGDLDESGLRSAAQGVWAESEKIWRTLPACRAYPRNADDETKKFVRYWFDRVNRRQLAALSIAISNVKERNVAEQLWCALSRLIIVKHAGASLAMDVSHSRPHRVYKTAPIKAQDRFLSSIEHIIRTKHGHKATGSYRIEVADARELPMRASSADLVITSPPYFNAIDYLRGHRLSLVWMGMTIPQIRGLRRTNIGAEIGACLNPAHEFILDKMIDRERTGNRSARMIARYLSDMHQVLRETARILKPGGEAIIVVGDCAIRGSFVRNSTAVVELGGLVGMKLISATRRRILAAKRYLPPPSTQRSDQPLGNRIRTESVITLAKA